MKLEHLERKGHFEGCTATFEESEIVLVGAGYDGTSSYRPGSRFAPQAIREETLYSQEDYSPYFEKDIKDRPIHDAGNLILPFGTKQRVLELIGLTIDRIFQSGKRPCLIGGEHLVSWPAIQAAHRHFPDLCVVQLDAHLDLMDNLFGDEISHGTVMRRSSELLGEKKRIYQVGIRSGSREEYQYARQHTQLFPFSVEEFVNNSGALRGRPIYLTIDLDVFDPSLLPGTGTPEAGGIFFNDYIKVLKALQGCQVIGCDLVELAPQIDPTHVSTIVAAKALRELLIAV